MRAETLRIGLTGGIASGKSTALQCFSELAVPVLDADLVAREVVAAGSPALAAVRAAFGEGILDDSGGLNRALLRQRVFTDTAARERLEAIVHPAVEVRMRAWLAQVKAPYCVLCVPLLLEKNLEGLVDRVLVVDTPEETQRERATRRDRAREQEIEAIMRSQLSRRQRLERADDVLVNDSGVETLFTRVKRLHRSYIKLAAAGSHGKGF